MVWSCGRISYHREGYTDCSTVRVSVVDCFLDVEVALGLSSDEASFETATSFAIDHYQIHICHYCVL